MMKILKKATVLFYSVMILSAFSVNNTIAQTVEIDDPLEKSFPEIIESTLLWALEISGSIALFALIVGGVMYITSVGDEQKVTTAKKIFNFTIIGLVLILLSYSIIKTLTDILT